MGLALGAIRLRRGFPHPTDHESAPGLGRVRPLGIGGYHFQIDFAHRWWALPLADLFFPGR